MAFRQPQHSGSPKSECGSVVLTMFSSSTLISTPEPSLRRRNGILRALWLLFRSLPALGVLFAFRVGPLPHLSFTHPVLPAVHTDRDDRPSRTRYSLPSTRTVMIVAPVGTGGPPLRPAQAPQ